MKKIMLDHGIPTAGYCRVKVEEELRGSVLRYPLMVKPVDSCGSAGITRVEEKEELGAAIRHACVWSRTGEAIVEEFKTGMEVSVYTYIKNGRSHIVTMTQRVSRIDRDDVKYVCSVYQAEVLPGLKARMEKIADRIADAFHLENTPLFFQSIVRGEEISVIEFSPRLGGGICYRIMELNSGYDMLETSICSYLHEPIADSTGTDDRYYFVHQLYAREGIFSALEGQERLLKDHVIDEVFLLKTKGAEISAEKPSSAKTAVMVVSGSTKEECLDKINTARELLEIRGEDGRKLLDRSLFLNKEMLEESQNAASAI